MAMQIDFIKSAQERLLATKTELNAELEVPQKERNKEKVNRLSAYITQLNEYINDRKKGIKDPDTLVLINKGIEALERQHETTKNQSGQALLGQAYWIKQASNAEKAAGKFFNQASERIESTQERERPIEHNEEKPLSTRQRRDVLARLRIAGVARASVGEVEGAR